MRYDDASQTGPTGHETVARPDVDTLPPGSYGPATGNAITGAGTSSGSSGADSVGAEPAKIIAVQGAGGQAGVANGNFQANGQFGVLSMDAQGNFSYVRNPGTPDGVKDVFNYTLADAHGANASTTLTIDIGQVAAAAAGQGVVALPAGVELSDIHVNGRDLVINMPDGTQMVIPGGAVFVPEITIGDVQVPPTNLAALLINSEPQPAAGPPGEPGGNWNDPIPPFDPGVPLGDLIPPTELGYTPPTFQEIFPGAHTPPTVIIETPDFPAGVVDASESVNEKGLPARDGNLPNEPAGSGEIADGNGFNNSDTSETNGGTIVFTAKDGLSSITIDGVAVTAVGQTIQGQYGVMTITGIDLGSGQITYSYTLSDNTSGDNTHDLFTVVVTDKTGDTATGTLTVNIIDDVPTARNDTDVVDANHTATGNVISGADTTSGAAGADTVGADNASLTAVSSNSSGQSDSSFDANGNLVVHGEFGTLTIKADGSYVYTLDPNTHGGANDVFTYTITDGDGDTSQATLTINVPAQNVPPVASDSAVTVSEEALATGNHDQGGSDSDVDSTTASGTINPSDANGDTLTISLGIPTGTYTSGGQTVNWSVSTDGHTLIGYTGSDPSQNHVVVVTIANDGTYNVQLFAQFDDPSGNGENSINFVVPATVDDGHGGSTVSNITVTVQDDTPIANNDTDTLDSNHTATGNVITGVGTTSGSAGADSYGADGPGGLIGVSSNFSHQSDTSFDANGNLVVHGEFGTLTIKADGSYVYTLDPNAHGGANDVFTYTIVDADGDQTTATLTINVPAQNVPPTATDSATTVSEEFLASGNHDQGGSDSDPNEDVTTVTVQNSDANGLHIADANGDALTVTLGAPAGTYTSGGQTVNWSLSPDGHTLTGYTGNDPSLNHVVVVTIDNSGTYTVELLAQFDDPSGNGENSINFVVPATVNDGHGGSTVADITVTVQDDTPTVSASLNHDATITVDESGPVPASASVALGGYTAGDDPDVAGSGPIASASTGVTDILNASVSYGADGPGSTTYSLVVENSVSGLTTTDGHAINLVLSSDGTIVGIVQGGAFNGEVAFAIGINGATGQVTIDQYLSLNNPDATNPNDPVHLSSGTVGVVVTAVDFDGDHVSSPVVDVSSQFTFLDDGPQITSIHATSASITIDESGPVPASATVSLGGYTGGDDPDVAGSGPIASANSNGASVVAATIDYGADGQGTAPTYSLVVDNAVSGLETTDGHAINLVLTADGTIVGIVSGGTFNGEVAFAIGINSSTGEVTVDQYLSLHNPDATNPNDPVHLDNGTIGVVVSATDGDGDPVSNSGSPVDISGQFTFLDDGPQITSIHSSSATVTIDESGPVPASATVSLGGYTGGDDPDVSGTGPIASANSGTASMITATIDYGADGQGTAPTYSLVVENAVSGLETTDGHAINLVLTSDGTIVGVVSGGSFNGEVAFAIGIDSSTGAVTIDQYLSLHNPDATNPNDPVYLNNGTVGVVVSATDGDGDPVSNSGHPVDISGQFTFLDDGPSVTPGLNENATVTVDESGPVPASATVALGGHTPGNDPDVAGSGPIAEGDTGSTSMVDANALFGADGPSITGVQYALVVDNAVSGLETTDGHAINLVLTSAGTIVGIVSGGTFNGDVAFAIGINGSTGVVTVDQYLSLHNPDATNPNDPVYLNGGTIGVVVTATDGDGDPVSNAANPVDISGQFTFLDDGPHLTDAHATQATVTVDESGPVPASATVALGTGNTGGNDPDVSGAGPIATGNSGSSVVSATIDFGADGQGNAPSYSLVVDNAVSGLETTDGHAINLVLTDAGTIVGIVSGGAFNGEVAFAIGVNSSTGVVTVDQYLSLHNPDATDPNDPVHLNNGTIGVVVSATDGDGDPVSNSGSPVDISGNFTFLDDGPQITSIHASSATVTVDESGPVPASATVALGTGNTGGNDPDVAGAGPIATGNSGGASMITASINYGADGQGSAPSYSLVVDNAVSGLTTTDGHAINLVLTDAGTIVGIVSGGTFNGEVAFAIGINSSTGAVTIDQYLSLHNPDATDPNDPVHLNNGTIGVVVSATDGDGDPVGNAANPVDISGQFTFLDDGPTAATNGNGVGTVTLDESRPVGSDTSGAGSPSGLATATINLAAGFVTGSGVNYGADGPGSVTYALHLSSSSVGSGLYALDPTDTSTTDGDGYGQGQQIMLTQSGNTITGAVGSTVYFTITINPATGVATFTQVNNIWNPNAGSSAAALDDTATLTTALASALQVQQIVTDGDGDTSTASINIGQGVFQIQDDGPTAIHPDKLTTTDAVQAKVFAYLDTDHSVVENFGTDGPGTITFANITNGMDSGLKSGGTEITYWLSADGQTLDARINSTNGSDGTLIFEVHIDQSTSQYDYTQFGIVDNGSGVSFNNLTSTKAGNVDIYGLGANTTGNPDVDAMLSATSGGNQSTINTDATSIGVGNQSMNPGDSLRIDFVKALTTDSGNATLGFDYTQHVDTNGFSQKIPQVVGQPTTVSFKVWALETSDTQSNFPDSNPTGGFSDSTVRTITSVGVQGTTALQPMVTFDISSLANGQTEALAYGISVTRNADGSVTFSGMAQGDTYEIGTSGSANAFNAVDVQDVTGKFDLGIFSLASTNVGNPVNLSYDLQIKDADGDTVAVPGAINIELDPSGSQSAAVVNNAASTLSPSSTTTGSSTSHTGSLVGSNDNHEHLHLDRALTAGQSAALMAALAAAGIEAEHSRLDLQALVGGQVHMPTLAPLASASIVAASFEPTHVVAPTHIVQPAAGSGAVEASRAGWHRPDMAPGDHVIGHAGKDAQAMTELLHGSGHSAHAPAPAASPVTAHGVVMPSAQQLAAAAAAAHGTGPVQLSSLAGQEPQHNEVVSKVLADSLQGGEGHGPSIDQLVNSLPGSHSAGAVIEALASHQGMAVSFGHIAFSMGFSGSHMVPMEEAMHAAAPPAHG